ncbi:dihydrolipoyllysine-residue acetyltransferase component of pyruvate dehydrogenase complex [Striga asiatica]|uniref:Dihydrolipoyllysine-residue acetyltransferase component of pyruvate dehydrogenase complex n=1 Tax=Striga asiatica TaxID=4170 RepID=A0A5A7Q775_STRAF|nr:dihydrolipoyllysine-residue acetyltransferase component of pyruvate dehydrogenase complex [Striga asiatica]
MDGSPYSSSSSDTSSPFSSSSSSPAKPASSPAVLSIECLKGSSRGGEWSGDMLQTGDVVEELRIGNVVMKSPFRNGKSGVQKILHGSYKNKETSIRVRVRRGSDEFAELQACIVPGDQFLGRKQYVLRAIDDPNYAVGFVDRTEAECFKLQASRSIRMVSALERAPLQDGYVSYPWERKMHEMLAIPSSSSFYSVLFLPKSSDKAGTRYNDLEDTLARAHAWINASQESGAPVVFMSAHWPTCPTSQTRAYYHGVDIGVVRAVRLWFSPLAGEIPVHITIKDSDTKLGFAISRTAEGFIYISSVTRGDVDGPSARSGLSHLHEQAVRSSRLLIVSRISNQKVLPWMVSTAGAIRCFDTVSLSQKLSLHRHTRVPVVLHVFLWDRNVSLAADADRGLGARPTSAGPCFSRDDVGLGTDTNGSLESREMEGDSSVESRESDSGVELRLDRDTAGEFSFRFRDFAIKNNWV